MRWISVLLLLAAPVFPGEEIVKEKQDKPTPPKTAQLAPGILPPVAPGATVDKGDDPDRRVVVNLDVNGQITIAGKRYSLDEFGSILKREARVLDEIEKRKGGSGMVELRAGVRASKMKVLIRADRNAPWLHAQWLLMACAEEKVYRLQIAAQKKDDPKQKELPVLDAKLKSWLPTDKGIAPAGMVTPEFFCKVHILPRQEVEGTYGPKDARVLVMRPRAFLYMVGSKKFDSFEKSLPLLKKMAKDAAKAGEDVIGEIKAGHKVPFGRVVAVLDAMQTLKLDRIEYFGTVIPTQEVRRSAVLPYPKRNYAVAR